jgi:hypothetical protein
VGGVRARGWYGEDSGSLVQLPIVGGQRPSAL